MTFFPPNKKAKQIILETSVYPKSPLAQNMLTDISLKTLKARWRDSILHPALCIDSLSEGHPVIFSLSSVIIPFPPREGKDRNNPAEIYGSPGAKLLCQSNWKTRAAVAEWDTERSRVSQVPVARLIDRHRSLHEQTLWKPTEKCCVRLSASMIHGGKCRWDSCLRLNDGWVQSDEIFCKYLQLCLRWIEEAQRWWWRLM